MGENEKIPRFLNTDGTKNSGCARKLRQLLICPNQVSAETINPEIINKLNDIIKNFLIEQLNLNIKWENIPPHAVFIDKSHKPDDKNAFYIADEQRIGIYESYIKGRDALAIIKVLLHEMIHLSSIHILRPKSPIFKRFSILSTKLNRDGNDMLRFGEGFDEALTEGLVKFIWYSSIGSHDKKSIKIKEAVFKHRDFQPYLIDPYDILYVKTDEAGGFSKEDVILFTYIEQRRVLKYVVDKILEHNSEHFSSLKDVYFMLFRMKYKPDISKEARLIDKSLGAGAFRILMRMGTKPESAKQTLDALKKLHAKSKSK